MENRNNKKIDARFMFLILQIVAAFTAVVFCVCARAIGGDFYSAVKGWYIDNFGEETSVEQVLAEKKGASVAYLSADVPANSIQVPLVGNITSPYGFREHPVDGEYSLHRGVDIGGEMGENIACAMDGVVIETGCGKSYGNYIIVKHSETLTTRYAHCSKVLANVGDRVAKGQIIALVGDTGNTTGPHLHFEICVSSEPIDPQWLFELI